MEFFQKKNFVLWNMAINRGELLKNAVLKYRAEERMSITALSKKAGYDQSTIYRHFADPDLPDHVMLRWGNVMGYDFRQDIPDLGEQFSILTDVDRPEYKKSQELVPHKFLEECEEKMDFWRQKYIEVLEKYSLLQDRFNQLKEG